MARIATAGGFAYLGRTDLATPTIEEGLKHLGVLYCAESPVCAQLGGLAALSAKLTGGTITTTAAAVSATSANYNAQCLTMKNAQPNLATVRGWPGFSII